MAYTGFITISTDAPNISEQAVTGEGATVLSNPKLLDDRARFNLIDDSPGIIRYDSIAGSSTRWNCIVAKGENGAPRYVRVGEGGAISTSETGESGSWTVRTSGTVNMLNFVIYDSYTSKYWAVGASGTMLSSSDGITWSAVSLPVDVASDNLTGIATDGNGNMAVSNGTNGMRGVVSTDSGATWTIVSFETSFQFMTVIWDGTYFVAGQQAGQALAMAFVLPESITEEWTRFTSGTFGAGAVNSIVVSGSLRVAARAGRIFTSPIASTPVYASWTERYSGADDLRLFVANGRVYAVGQNGVSLESTDNGVTWQAGPPVGVTSFLRFGVADANDPTRAIVVGDAGVTLFGQYSFNIICYESDTNRTNRGPELGKVQEAYVDMPKRVVVPNLLEIDVAYFTP